MRYARRVDPCDRIAHHTHAETGEAIERALSRLQRGLTRQCPGLAEACHKIITPVHQDDFIVFVELLLEPPRGSNAAEPTTQDQDPFHDDLTRGSVTDK